jgi:hypothetical protein
MKPRVQSGCLGWTALGIAGWLLTSLLFVGVCSRLQYLGPLQTPWFLIWLLLFWAIASFGLSRWQVSLARKRFESERSDIESEEMAEVLTVSASEAIRVDEFEDEGLHYFLRLSDDRVLFLSGQYLYDHEEEKRFPCTEFDVVRTVRSKIILGLECRGAFLPPVKVLPPFSTEQFHKDIVPQDMDILDIPWSEIESRYASQTDQ